MARIKLLFDMAAMGNEPACTQVRSPGRTIILRSSTAGQLLVNDQWSLINTIIKLCGITALFAIFLETNKLENLSSL